MPRVSRRPPSGAMPGPQSPRGCYWTRARRNSGRGPGSGAAAGFHWWPRAQWFAGGNAAHLGAAWRREAHAAPGGALQGRGDGFNVTLVPRRPRATGKTAQRSVAAGARSAVIGNPATATRTASTGPPSRLTLGSRIRVGAGPGLAPARRSGLSSAAPRRSRTLRGAMSACEDVGAEGRARQHVERRVRHVRPAPRGTPRARATSTCLCWDPEHPSIPSPHFAAERGGLRQSQSPVALRSGSPPRSLRRFGGSLRSLQPPVGPTGMPIGPTWRANHGCRGDRVTDPTGMFPRPAVHGGALWRGHACLALHGARVQVARPTADSTYA